MCELPYIPSEWETIECVQTSPAQENMVGRGSAVFAQRPPALSVHPMALPRPAIWTDDDGAQRAGVIVQAEPINGDSTAVALGAVEPNGQNHVVLLENTIILSEPSERWIELASVTANREGKK